MPAAPVLCGTARETLAVFSNAEANAYNIARLIIETLPGHYIALADRTPAQAGMVMAKRPRPPTGIEVAWMSLFSCDIPDEWKEHLPADSPWLDYWDVELDS